MSAFVLITILKIKLSDLLSKKLGSWLIFCFFFRIFFWISHYKQKSRSNSYFWLVHAWMNPKWRKWSNRNWRQFISNSMCQIILWKRIQTNTHTNLFICVYKIITYYYTLHVCVVSMTNVGRKDFRFVLPINLRSLTNRILIWYIIRE